MNITRFIILLSAFALVVGCAAPKPTPDPLAGWKPIFGREYEKVDGAVKCDYQDYIQILPTEERNRASLSPIFLFEDGTGQHAVRFTIGLNGIVWEHVLIYDKDNKRIKAIKYASGHYAS